jgi:predicted TIM-barrel fold metal-dependent hydrolase
MPYDAQVGDVYTRETIVTVERMTVSDSEKRKIFEDNAREVMRLPV